MKKTYVAPKLQVHGSVEELTQQSKVKKFGANDGFAVAIPGAVAPIAIGS